MNNKTAFTTTLTFDDPSLAQQLFGPLELYLKELSRYSGASFSTRGTELFISANSAKEQEQLALLFAKRKKKAMKPCKREKNWMPIPLLMLTHN